MQMMDIQSYKHSTYTQAKERHIKQQIFFKEKNEKEGDFFLEGMNFFLLTSLESMASFMICCQPLKVAI